MRFQQSTDNEWPTAQWVLWCSAQTPSLGPGTKPFATDNTGC